MLERWFQRQCSAIDAAAARTRYVVVIVVVVVNSVNITIIAANSSLFRHFADDETDVASTTTVTACVQSNCFHCRLSSDRQIGYAAERLSR